MLVRVLLVTTLCHAATSLSPSPMNEFQSNVCGIGLAVMTAFPLPSAAVEVVRMEADIPTVPALIQMAKDNRELALKLAQQAASKIHITRMPSNLFEFARDAAAGDLWVEINGFPIDVSLLSETGAIDVAVSTEKGDVSLTVASKFLPKLPLLSKRVVPILSVDKATTATTETATERYDMKESFLDKPFIFDPFHKGWTNLQVLGTGTLVVSASYATSYAYYLKVIEDEETLAREKKAAAAEKAAIAAAAKRAESASAATLRANSAKAMAKKAEAAAAVKKAEAADATKSAELAVKEAVAENAAAKESAKMAETAKREAALWKVLAETKRADEADRAEKERKVVITKPSTGKKKRKWLKFWQKYILE